MKFIHSMRYRMLYMLWAVLFAATAVLGLAFPAADGFAKAVLQLISVVFFLPPWLILFKAREEGSRHQRTLVRLFCVASLVLTTVLMCLNILSAKAGDEVGNVLHWILTVVSSPMVCSNFYVLPLFLWAALLMFSFSKAAKTRS